MPRASWTSVKKKDPFSDELDQYDTYDGECPPKGVYRWRLKILRLVENKNNEPMIKALFILIDSGDKAKYNGYQMWTNLNVTDAGTRYINNLLDALAPAGKEMAVRKAFWDQKVMVDKDENAPNIVSIGTLKLDGLDEREVYVKASTKYKTYQGDKDLAPVSFLRDDGKGPKAADKSEEEGWEEGQEEVAESEEEEDEEVAERADELSELSAVDLKKILKTDHGLKIADYKGKSVEELVNMILDLEFPPEDDDADEESEEDEDVEEQREQREEELGELDTAGLKKVLKGLGFKIAEYKGKDDAALIEMVLDKELPLDEDGSEETEAEEEPEAEEEKPAARARTGRRGRAANSGKPPF